MWVVWGEDLEGDEGEVMSKGPRQPSGRKLLSTHLSLLAEVAILQHCRTGAKEVEPTESDTVRKLLKKI